jgi:hypothetical protein
MIVNSTLLAAFILLGSLTLAEAQPYVNGGSPAPGTTLGWNYDHISFCATFSDGVITWYYAFTQGGGLGYTNNPGFATSVAAACQTGNLIAVHVTSLNPFLWNWIATYPFK